MTFCKECGIWNRKSQAQVSVLLLTGRMILSNLIYVYGPHFSKMLSRNITDLLEFCDDEVIICDTPNTEPMLNTVF